MYRLGLDIGATKTAIAIINEHGTLFQLVKLPSTQALQQAATPADSLASSIRNFCQQAGLELTEFEGIGIGFPGVMDRLSETITSCPNLQVLDGQPLGRDLTQRLGVPTFLENDVNLITLGEHFKGRGKDVKDLVCIYVGSGIGCGLVLNGQLYVGADGAAGEFGHTVIEPAGLPCTCGGQGCLDMYCSGKALALQAASILGISPMSVRRLIQQKILPARQTVPTAPWRIEREQLKSYAVVRAVQVIKGGRRAPLPPDPNQRTLIKSEA